MSPFPSPNHNGRQTRERPLARSYWHWKKHAALYQAQLSLHITGFYVHLTLWYCSGIVMP